MQTVRILPEFIFETLKFMSFRCLNMSNFMSFDNKFHELWCFFVMSFGPKAHENTCLNSWGWECRNLRTKKLEAHEFTCSKRLPSGSFKLSWGWGIFKNYLCILWFSLGNVFFKQISSSWIFINLMTFFLKAHDFFHQSSWIIFLKLMTFQET